MLMCCSTRYGHLGLCVTFAVKRCLLDILAWGMQPLRIRMPTKLHAMVETSLHSSVPAEMMTLRFLLGPVVSRTHDQPLLTHPGQRVLPPPLSPQAGGQWTTITHCPTKTSDRSVVKQCGTPHCVPAEFLTQAVHPTFPRFDSWWFHMILSPQTGFPLHCSC